MLEKLMQRVQRNANAGKRMAENSHEKRTGESIDMDTRAQSTNNIIELIVALTIGGLIAAFLIPIAVDELAAANAGENWSDGAAALWGILDVMIVLGVFLFFTGVALRSTNQI